MQPPARRDQASDLLGGVRVRDGATATSRQSEHGGPGDDAEIDRWLAEAADEPDIDLGTPVGTTGAGPADNPDTAEADLQQPGTEPLIDPATAKAIRSESQMLRKDADLDKE